MERFLNFHLHVLVLFVSSEIFSSDGDSPGKMIIAVGDSVTFPSRVPDTGNLVFNGHTIAQVFKTVSAADFRDDFMNRLHWANQTGLFTISHLRVNDSGRYTVESLRAPEVKQDYQVEVYEKVSDPHVKSTTFNSSGFCSVRCTARYVKGLRLTWYEDYRLISSTNSGIGSNVTIEFQLEPRNLANHPYSCVASNPVGNKSTTVNTVLSCPLNTDVDTDVDRWSFDVMLIAVLSSIVFILIFFWYQMKK